VVTGTPGVGKSLFGIYMLYQILHGHYPEVTSIIYRQSSRNQHTAWAYERTAAGGWQQCLATSKVKVPSLFIHDNSSNEKIAAVRKTRNIYISPPREVNSVSRQRRGVEKIEQELRHHLPFAGTFAGL
jgi:hypothetical protein